MSTGLAERSYTEAEIEAMDTPDLLSLYKRTGDETLKWPLVLRYEGLIKSAALQIRGVQLRPGGRHRQRGDSDPADLH